MVFFLFRLCGKRVPVSFSFYLAWIRHENVWRSFCHWLCRVFELKVMILLLSSASLSRQVIRLLSLMSIRFGAVEGWNGKHQIIHICSGARRLPSSYHTYVREWLWCMRTRCQHAKTKKPSHLSRKVYLTRSQCNKRRFGGACLGTGKRAATDRSINQ